MGLIKEAIGIVKNTVGTVAGMAKESITSTLEDQVLSGIRCDNMGNDTLMKKVTNPDGIIANGSRIIVAPGQVAVIYDNGKIADATAEPGVYTFKTEAAPSFFGGDFGAVFKDMWDRFKFGGVPVKEQAVYFFNVTEIINNNFGTPNPIPYKDWGHPLTNPRTNTLMAMSVYIKCYGKYTFRIANPALFMEKIAGGADIYKVEQITEQIRGEVLDAFSNLLNSLGDDEYKVEAMSLRSKTDEIKEVMKQSIFDEPIRNRGLEIVTFTIENVSPDAESQKKFDQYEMGSDAYQQKAVLTDAYAEAVKSAASNEAGAMNGFIGVGMANMSSGNAFGGIMGGMNNQNAAPNQTQNQTYAPVETNKPFGAAAVANTNNENNVSAEEVKEEPAVKEEEKKEEENSSEEAPKMKFCPNCGRKLNGEKFCPECGTKLS